MNVAWSTGCLIVSLMLAGCTNESRSLAADQPQTPPTGAGDPRVARYQGNAYQISQGGRYFAWYGCGRCHGNDADGAMTLQDRHHRHGDGFDEVYRYIAGGHPGDEAHYGERVPVEQLWQITAYVRDLPTIEPEKRRRQDVDAVGEPQGSQWSGPIR